MSDFEKIESIVKDLTTRVQRFHSGDWVALYFSGGTNKWWATSAFTLRWQFTGNDPFEALSDLETALREREADFGYEAAE